MREKNRNTFIIFLIALIISIIILFFIKNNYKNQNLGNTISNKNIQGIEEYILNISSYNAKIEVTVESNKNTNKYLMEQHYEKDKFSKQIILEPSNISGVEVKYEDSKLIINNSKLNLVKVYENYNYLVENCLWLDSFIQDYIEAKKESSAIINEKDNVITMEAKTRNNDNKYIYYKQLTIDKITGKPTKLLVQDMNKKNLIYILYNEITVNGLN